MTKHDAVVYGATASVPDRRRSSPIAATVTALDHVTFTAVDVESAVAFYRDVWHLVPQPGRHDGTVTLRAGNEDGASLVLRPSDVNALHHVAFRARSVGSTGDSEPTFSLGCTERPGAPRDILVDPDGRTVELVAVDEPDRDEPTVGPNGTDGKTADGGEMVPAMGHVVLASPDLEASEAFYRDRLGFRATDRTARGMVFLRCNRDHHTVAIARTGTTGVQHVAYDVGTIDQVMQNMARLRDLGVPCIWGPGRHGPGHNVFAYYRDPLGCVVEQFADMERVDPDAPVQERWWGPDWPGDLWGLAGPPSREFLDSVLAVGSAK